ncbi:MAG: rhomboid family intramembrane serine protease, partial [Planctomycetes bacterium]|nr:rhomboid family intramembrane serine protease [Planctomycetota bacterium]
MSEMMRGPRMAFPSLTSGVKALLLINVAVFLANAILGGELNDWFAVSVNGLADGYGLGVFRLLTSQFSHSYTDIGHILGNMLVLYFFGTMVESEVGRRGIVKLYLASGFTGNFVQLPFMAAMGSADVQCLGASGACFGIMVYAAVMAPSARVW